MNKMKMYNKRMNIFINNLLKDFTIADIESALVQSFVENNKINVKENKLILGILQVKSKDIVIIKERVKNSIDAFDLKSLEKAFELLIPKEDRKINGAFFTPTNITAFISEELIHSESQRICDPSCGCGAFLIAAADLFKNKFSRKISEIIKNNIYGVDVLDYSIRRCKIILTLLALMNGEDKKSLEFNIICKDSLKNDWRKLFPSVMENGGFDVVLGNPPYVKYQDLPENIRIDLFNNWKTLKQGTYNLYFAFFELGINIMKKNGRLGYITPNNYFTSLAAISLREYLQINHFIDKIIDFNHIRIFDSQTYTCITFLSKTKNAHFLFEKIEDRSKLNEFANLTFSKITYENLNRKKWRLLREKDQKNIKKIESMPYNLGSLFDIRVGIATCRDTVYFIDGKTFDGKYYRKIYKDKQFLIEEGITRPIDKISDFDTQESLEFNTRRIIFPYYIKSGEAILIPKSQLKKKYPKCYEYFINAEPELKIRDKQKCKYEEWYAYARTQGLVFKGEKLLTPTFSKEPRFLYDKNPETLFCNGYGIFKQDKADLLAKNISLSALSKILNSKIMNYYVKNTSVSIEGGFYCYQKNFIELFGIPELSKEDFLYLQREIDKRKVDKFLLEKYNINL